jgi:hypothetical protein
VKELRKLIMALFKLVVSLTKVKSMVRASKSGATKTASMFIEEIFKRVKSADSAFLSGPMVGTILEIL